MQIVGEIGEVLSPYPINKKFESFGFNVLEIDGHNYDEIYNALIKSKDNAKPTAIIAHTIKGKGISFMENNPSWHGKAPNDEQLDLALKELFEGK